MSNCNHITEYLAAFRSVTLEEIENVKLMNRIDQKFVFPENVLPEILSELKNDYDILEIEGKRCMQYETEYLDTEDFYLYHLHHKDKANRFKVRIRKYLDTHASFLEVKIKNNKGRTIKKREPIETMPDSQKLEEFMRHHRLALHSKLVPSVKNHFNRITLVNKNRKERLTLDINLHFAYGGKEIALKGMVIAEVKRDKTLTLSPFIRLMRKHHIASRGISKYIMGGYYLIPRIKKNMFKMKIRELLNQIKSYVTFPVA